jgi:hypothetical protein
MNPREWPGRIWSRVRHPSRKGLIVMAAAVFLATVGVAAATLTFTQTVPTQVAPGAQVSGCSTLVYDAAASSNDTTNAWVIFNCGGSTQAFTTGAAGSYTPSFGSGSGETDIYIISAPPSGIVTTGCSQFGGAHPLTTSVAVTGFTAGSAWDYCMDAPVGATISSFTVTWT